MSKIKIVSDGTPYGIRVYDPEGKELKNILSIEIAKIMPGDFVSAKIEFLDVELDLHAQTVVRSDACHAALSLDRATD